MFTSTGFDFNAVKRFFEAEQFIKATDFAGRLKRRHKNGKKRK